jgi:periplasmic divalent cation tolerance protein
MSVWELTKKHTVQLLSSREELKTMTYILVLVTASGKSEVEKIVHTLLEEKFIACASIFGPIFSHFWWQGKIDSAEEYLVFMKSEEHLFERLAERVKQLHSYEVPEIIALPIIKGFKPYLKWLSESLSSGE